MTSSSFLIAAVIDETWDLGVVTGDDQGNIWLLYILGRKNLKNMRISTALIGDYLPPGIPIGKIWETVRPAVDFYRARLPQGAHLTQLYGVQIYQRREWGHDGCTLGLVWTGSATGFIHGISSRSRLFLVANALPNGSGELRGLKHHLVRVAGFY